MKPEAELACRSNWDLRDPYGDASKIRMRFTLEEDAGLQMIEVDDTYEITATVVDSDMLHWWSRAFGDAVWGVEKQVVENF